ncbi:helix-turn-helix domain-containing protein [Planobispora siamensis]|uniref:MerR family transcriptional regulator n=1 Tax=Planobispora siamensis TaxID=936338 RepID=A0A8J3SMC6_9ACTN|nr:helix-turn-helix domain-containing protein [Planobispora siamensis]GIH97076.1 MerR family transcriptional regulator [Planobispora siamensis]
MSERQPYSVEQVANLLGLHVKTVRNYVRDGRLKAVRIGKQYRIAAEDLDAFAGRPVAAPARETTRRRRHVEASSIVQIDAISTQEMTRLSNTLIAAVGGRHDSGRPPLRVETVYDEERASMKIIILGDLDGGAELFKIISALLGDGP